MARDYPLLIGSCGWVHSAWLVDFYPEDLPLDWRLGYYANEFPVVMVTAREWELPEANPVRWCEDTETSFRFVIEITVDPNDTIQRQRDRLTGFGERCSGIVLRINASMAVSAINAQLDAIGNSWPVCLDFGNSGPNETVMHLLREREIGWCWHGVGTAEGLNQGALGVTRIHSQEDNPQQVRQWVETALASSTAQRQSILLFEGDPPSIAVMRQAQIIMDLL